MRTRCPSCQTVFRITTEQIKARIGKVRCGHCQSVFNALDSLLSENIENPLSFPDINISIPPLKIGMPEEPREMGSDEIKPTGGVFDFTVPVEEPEQKKAEPPSRSGGEW